MAVRRREEVWRCTLTSGGVAFTIKEQLCSRDIKLLAASITYLPCELTSVIMLAVYIPPHPPQTLMQIQAAVSTAPDTTDWDVLCNPHRRGH